MCYTRTATPVRENINFFPRALIRYTHLTRTAAAYNNNIIITRDLCAQRDLKTTLLCYRRLIIQISTTHSRSALHNLMSLSGPKDLSDARGKRMLITPGQFLYVFTCICTTRGSLVWIVAADSAHYACDYRKS